MKPLKSLLLTLIIFASVLSANAADAATSKKASTATDAEIAKAAKSAGINASKLKAAAKRDKDMRISSASGAAFYACRRNTAKIANPSDPESFTTATLFPFTKTFLLHSRPGSTKVIYLDFKGHTTKGSYWNTDRRGTSIVTPPFDTDGKPGTFNYVEHAIIQKIWKEVSDAYAVFDVDVTTQDPGVENIRKTAVGDNSYGVRVCIGGKVSYLPNWQEIVTDADELFGITPEIGCFNKQVFQVAYANDAPVLVFSDMLYQRGSAKDIADTTVHELGHAFGLSHSTTDDGTTQVEYYPGHNDWAPYMGDTMGKSVAQWTKGDYDANATNNEDELAIIATYAPYVADDHGNNIAGATSMPTPAKVKSTAISALPVYLYTSSATGLINNRADKDFFKIDVGGGEFYIEATAADPQANLNIQIKLYKSDGTEVVNSDPYGMPYEEELGMSDSFHHYDLTKGTYYISIEGVGAYWDEATASFVNEYIDASVPRVPANDIPADSSYDSTTGTITNIQYQAFTDYASIGRYTLKTTGWGTPNNIAPVASTAGTTQAGGMAPSTVKFVGSGSYSQLGVITNYLWDFGDGTSSTLANPTHVYTTAGSYTATLLVTDNSNETSAPVTLPITVKAVSSTKAVNVLAVSVAWVKASYTTGYFVATINVGDQNEKPIAGAVVSVTSSGLASGTATATTNAQGVVTIKSAVMPTSSTGTETFTVTNVVLIGYPYNAANNTVTSGSLTK
jgi:PKD repeat protein